MFNFVPINKEIINYELEQTVFEIYLEIRNKIKLDFSSFYKLFYNSIYTVYSKNLKKNYSIFNGFDYSINSISILNTDFWKVVSIDINNIKYLYNKHTNAILYLTTSSEGECNICLFGILLKEYIVYKKDIPNFVLEWFGRCGIKSIK